MHLSFASLWVDPWGTHGSQGSTHGYSFGISYFPHRGRELFSFGNDFAGPQGHTHGICLSFGQRYISLGQNFLAPLIYLYAKFRYYVVGVYTFP